MPQWRRTFYTLWVTQFLALVGFGFVLPFVPFFIQDLGVTDTREAALWAGLVNSVQAATSAVMAPVWGMLADRHGRKLMVMRATFSTALTMTLMGFVTNVQQLVLLRALQGVFTGTVPATTTLIASQTPRERVGAALGALQTAIALGTTLGPLLGGAAADWLGYRSTFFFTGGLLFLSGLLVLLFVHEEFDPNSSSARDNRVGYGTALKVVLASSALMAAFAARLLIRAGGQAASPVLALTVQAMLPGEARLGLITGLVSGATAVGTAIGAPIIGLLGDRVGYQRVIVVSTLVAAACFVPQFSVQTPWALALWQGLSGLALGGTVSCLAALLAQLAPAGRHGVIFGIDASAHSLGVALGPMAGALVAATLGLRAPFLLSTLFLVGASGAVVAGMAGHRPAAAHERRQ